MKNYLGLPRNEIQELTETILADFYKGKNIKDIAQIDIAYLAQFLKMSVAYAHFAENDMNKLGYLSDGVAPLLIIENGKQIKKKYGKNTIVLDEFLSRPENEAKRRYTIGHKIGHYLLALYGYAPVEAAFSNSFDRERTYSYEELREMLKLNEFQANEVGAFLLMPAFLIDRYVKEQFGDKPILVYGRYMMYRNTKLKIQKMPKNSASMKAADTRRKVSIDRSRAA